MIIDEITNEMEYENSNSPYTNPALTEKDRKWLSQRMAIQ